MDKLAEDISKNFTECSKIMGESIVTVSDSSEEYLKEFSKKHNDAIKSIQEFSAKLLEVLQEAGIQGIPPKNTEY